MKKRFLLATLATLVMFILLLGAAGPASAHFGMVIPSDQMVMGGEEKEITIELKFWHPFEDHGMELMKPARFGVVANGKEIDLLGTLQPTRTGGRQTWMTRYRIMRPGVYAALSTADTRIKYNGEDKEVELGAVLWVKFHNME